MQNTRNLVLVIISILLFAIAGVFIYLIIQEKTEQNKQASQTNINQKQQQEQTTKDTDNDNQQEQIKTYQELKSESENTFQAGWRAAEKRLESLGFTPSTEEKMTSISGEITSIGNNQLKIATDAISPLAEKTEMERTIKINNETKIYKLTENPEAFNEENFGEGQEEPEFFNRSEASLQDLKENQFINVITNEDIRGETRLTATEIEFEVFEEESANEENAIEEINQRQAPASEEENPNQEQGEQIQQEEVNETVNQE